MLKSQKNKLVQIFNSKIFLAVSLVIFLLMTYATIQEIRKRNAIGREIQDLRDEIRALENQNVELSKLLEYVKTDTYAELEARAKLGRSLPGEKVVVIPSDESRDTGTQDAQSGKRAEEDYTIPVEIDHSQYTSAQKWWLYFFAPSL